MRERLAIEAQLNRAKDLIRDKKYTEARNLLQGIDHPTARNWLTKLDNLQRQPLNRSQSLPFSVQILLIIVICLMIGGGIGYYLGRESILAPLRDMVGGLENLSYDFQVTFDAFDLPTLPPIPEFPELRIPAPPSR